MDDVVGVYEEWRRCFMNGDSSCGIDLLKCGGMNAALAQLDGFRIPRGSPSHEPGCRLPDPMLAEAARLIRKAALPAHSREVCNAS